MKAIDLRTGKITRAEGQAAETETDRRKELFIENGQYAGFNRIQLEFMYNWLSLNGHTHGKSGIRVRRS